MLSFFLIVAVNNKMYTLSLHDALPISTWVLVVVSLTEEANTLLRSVPCGKDRKSTRLHSSHISTAYDVFYLKKKTVRAPAAADGELLITVGWVIVWALTTA